MRIFLTTVAGSSSRFSASLGREALKCIYYETDPQKTLLFRQLQMAGAYDRLVVVGGYRFEELAGYLERYLSGDIKQKLLLVHNEEYAEYGSGWSFLKGIRAVQALGPEEILFAEGDLAFGQEDFCRIEAAPGDVVTFTQGPIDARTSVAGYLSPDGRVHYLYDVRHGVLRVEEPFVRMFNSGQIWKFSNPKLLYAVADSLPEQVHQRTNLEMINAYFAGSSTGFPTLAGMGEWINCNTVSEFRAVHWEE
ncbi:MAG: licC domain protein [Clostridiaceae bacterium]|nr:licC domain protein [Clostridiaceae bacterium]